MSASAGWEEQGDMAECTASRDARSEYLRKRSAEASGGAAGQRGGLAENARAILFGAATALLIGLGAAAVLEFVSRIGAQATAETAPALEASAVGAESWADLAAYQKLSVAGALITIAAVMVGAAGLARKRAHARWCAARERRRLASAPSLRSFSGLDRSERRGKAPLAPNPTRPVRSASSERAPEPAPQSEPAPRRSAPDPAPRSKPAPLPQRASQPIAAPARDFAPAPPRKPTWTVRGASPRAESAGIDAYIESFGAAEPAAEQRRPASAATARPSLTKDAPTAWRTAHARRMRRFERLARGAELTLEHRQSALSNRIAKLGRAETERRKNAERRV